MFYHVSSELLVLTDVIPRIFISEKKNFANVILCMQYGETSIHRFSGDRKI
jgi:hypothetical protein